MPSAEIRRPMMQCVQCHAWWSGPPVFAGAGTKQGQRVDPDEPETCGCGGALMLANLEQHNAKLPYAPFDPSKEKKPDKKPGSAPKPEQ